jgi:hypothetical protein
MIVPTVYFVVMKRKDISKNILELTGKYKRRKEILIRRPRINSMVKSNFFEALNYLKREETQDYYGKAVAYKEGDEKRRLVIINLLRLEL